MLKTRAGRSPFIDTVYKYGVTISTNRRCTSRVYTPVLINECVCYINHSLFFTTSETLLLTDVVVASAKTFTRWLSVGNGQGGDTCRLITLKKVRRYAREIEPSLKCERKDGREGEKNRAGNRRAGKKTGQRLRSFSDEDRRAYGGFPSATISSEPRRKSRRRSRAESRLPRASRPKSVSENRSRGAGTCDRAGSLEQNHYRCAAKSAVNDAAAQGRGALKAPSALFATA